MSERSIAQRTLDVLVYAPAGLVMTALDDLPALAAKGRARIEVEVRNARLVGRMAVVHGRRGLERRVTSFVTPPAPTAPSQPSPSRTRSTAVGLAIPDYDTLSASQVVRRLDGLGRRELEEVARHEAATRGRRTILHRAQQLLGSEHLPEAP